MDSEFQNKKDLPEFREQESDVKKERIPPGREGLKSSPRGMFLTIRANKDG